MVALLMREKKKGGSRPPVKQPSVKCSERFRRAITELANLKSTSQPEECDKYLKSVEDELSEVMARRQAELDRLRRDQAK